MEPVLRNKRIFIVEDSVTNMAVFNMLLRDGGATVVQDFMNADSVNLLLQHLPVDIILMDLTLRNGLTGYDLFERVRAVPDLAGIPVIAVSGADAEAEIPRVQASGFTGYIRKPVDPKLFPAQIADCLVGKPVWVSQMGQFDRMAWPVNR